ncbi:MAG: ABC transporter permease [Bacteroidota bacterium]
MRTLRFLLQKEFKQIFRDPAIIRLIFIMPAIQLLVMPLAADFEVKNVNIAIVDQDHSAYTKRMTEAFSQSAYFNLVGYFASYEAALSQIESDEADLIIQFPLGFEEKLIRENHNTVFMAVNAINGVKANLGSAYATRVMQGFSQDIRTEWITLPRFSPQAQLQIESSNWYNATMNFQIFMVPGILAILMTMIGAFLAALNIVKEKEVGTIEQLNVTPIRKHHFILGKLIPFWILGLVIFTIGLGISYVAYGLFPLGNLGLLYGFAAVFLITILGFGLLISTLADTQQQAMFIAFFFILIFILLSGLFTSLDSMPDWAQVIARMSPVTYFVETLRMIVLKGSSFQDVQYNLMLVSGMGVLLNGLAIWNYRKTN